MPVVKRVLAIAILLAAIAAFGAPVAAATLTQGGVKKGTVSVTQRGKLRYAAVDEIFSALGLAQSPADGGLVTTYSGKKVEFWDSSEIVRVNGMVSPLPGAVFREDGHWWCECDAALRAMDNFLASIGRPTGLKLEDAGISSPPAAQVPSAQAPVTQVPAPQAAPSKNNQPASAKSAGRAQVNGIRWGQQESAYRAVIDISSKTDVKVDLSQKGIATVTLTGAAASKNLDSSSPWPPLAVRAGSTSGSVVLSFAHAAGGVKYFWLTEPARLVVDFLFSGAEPVQAVSPAPAAPATAPSQPKKPAGTQAPASKKRALVVVDAGHGGHDPGAMGNSLKEKDINLKAALELEASLKSVGLDVRLTRRDDRYLKLAERTAFANDHNADIFISLHCNALPKGRHATGTEMYLMADSTDKDALNLAVLENRELSGNAQTADEVNAAADKRTKLLLQILGDMQQNDKISESTTLAEYLYNGMKSQSLPIKRVRQAPFFVLRGAGMPALLIEMGFITEASDAKLLNSAAHRKKLMDATARGIKNYLASGRGGA